jgi:hypothetical protein
MEVRRPSVGIATTVLWEGSSGRHMCCTKYSIVSYKVVSLSDISGIDGSLQKRCESSAVGLVVHRWSEDRREHCCGRWSAVKHTQMRHRWVSTESHNLSLPEARQSTYSVSKMVHDQLMYHILSQILSMLFSKNVIISNRNICSGTGRIIGGILQS